MLPDFRLRKNWVATDSVDETLQLHHSMFDKFIFITTYKNMQNSYFDKNESMRLSKSTEGDVQKSYLLWVANCEIKHIKIQYETSQCMKISHKSLILRNASEASKVNEVLF